MLWIRSIFATSINQSSSGMKSYNKKFVYSICLVSAMGGLLFGYDWVVIGGAKPFYEQYFGIANDPVMQGWAMSSALIGCLFGALSAGKLSDRLGRKPILILAAGLFICTAVGTGAVHSFTFFNVFRLVGGFAIGIASSFVTYVYSRNCSGASAWTVCVHQSVDGSIRYLDFSDCKLANS